MSTVSELSDKAEYCVVLKNERNLIWFTVSDISYNVSERLLNSDKKSINLIKKSMSRLNFGHKRRLLLNGVGFKADVISGVGGMPVLSLKIGNQAEQLRDLRGMCT